MMTSKKNIKSTFEDFEHFIEETKYIKSTPINKKATKRPQADTETIDFKTDEIPKSGRKCPPSVKKQKENMDLQNLKEIRGKLLEAMEGQFKTMKQGNDILLNDLSEVIGEIKQDCMVLKSNQEKIQILAAAFVKCISQATSAHESKLTILNEIHGAFKKQCEDMESEHKSQASKLAGELEEDIKKLHQKLINETRRSSIENLKKLILQSFQNDF